MRRRRRNSADYRLEYKGGREIIAMFDTRLDFRTILRTPFKWNRREIFERCIEKTFDEPILHAVKLIEQSPFHKRLYKQDSFILKHGDTRLTIDLPIESFAAYIDDDEHTFRLGLLTPKLQGEIKEWLTAREKLKRENEQFTRCVKALFDSAGTWGQAVRIWPDLRNLLMECEAAQHFFAEQKARSPIPSTFDPTECGWDLEFMNTMLAELLLLGDPDDGQDIDVVKVYP